MSAADVIIRLECIVAMSQAMVNVARLMAKMQRFAELQSQFENDRMTDDGAPPV